MVHSPNKNILNEEIKSWERFEYALREENRLLFTKMQTENASAASSKDEYCPTESLFMSSYVFLRRQNEIMETYYADFLPLLFHVRRLSDIIYMIRRVKH